VRQQFARETVAMIAQIEAVLGAEGHYRRTISVVFPSGISIARTARVPSAPKHRSSC
jgi:hypothetical protein